MNPFDRLASRDAVDGRARRVYGLVFAEVRRITDSGYILEYLSRDLGEESAPARAATMMAGGRRGSFLMPEVGDEVVVGFENGDIDRPVILGALWSDQDPPPDQADTSESNDVRTIVSRAGHEVTFDDSQGSTKVTIRSAGGHTVELVDGSGGGISLRTSGGARVELQSSPSKVTIQADQIELKTTGVVATSLIKLDQVSWNHMHAGQASAPPVSPTST